MKVKVKTLTSAAVEYDVEGADTVCDSSFRVVRCVFDVLFFHTFFVFFLFFTGSLVEGEGC